MTLYLHLRTAQTMPNHFFSWQNFKYLKNTIIFSVFSPQISRNKQSHLIEGDQSRPLISCLGYLSNLPFLLLTSRLPSILLSANLILSHSPAFNPSVVSDNFQILSNFSAWKEDPSGSNPDIPCHIPKHAAIQTSWRVLQELVHLCLCLGSLP